MADSGIAPVGNGGAWGPRADEFNQNIELDHDDAALQYAQDYHQPADVRSIVMRARPSDPPPSAPDPHDEVKLSPRARCLLKGGSADGRR